MSKASWICWLDEPDEGRDAYEGNDRQIDALGGKGANLKRLSLLGLPVPAGFVITTAAYRAFLAAHDLENVGTTDPASLRERLTEALMPDALSAAILAAYRRLGGGPVAVRSSGTAEDLATASFAGQHDTFLDVSGADTLLSAVRACWASLWAPRAVAYRLQRGWDDHTGGPEGRAGGRAAGATPLALAVVVQVMVQAEAAGVAFTANPVTGTRGEATVSAVRGLGERLVSGESVADEWVVRGIGADAEPVHLSSVEAGAAVLTTDEALAVASLARRIERHFGAPQDVEWAIAAGKLYVLQARPMTALPMPIEPATWTSPVPGGWMRNFRLGEWLPEPVTPLCDSWLLARIEAGEIAAEERDFGLRPRPPYHVLAHGWYFSSPIGGGLPLRGVATALTRHPRALLALALSTSRPDLAERSFIAQVARRWREALMPRYQRLVASAEAQLEAATPAELIHAIDAVAGVAGEYLWDFSAVGGHAWKAEHALARFCRRYLPSQLEHGHQELLLGLPIELPAPYPASAPYAVQSLDWIRPTLGESFPDPPSSRGLVERREQMEKNREVAEAACRAALAGMPRRLQRFDAVLALAQRYAILREEQASWFTLGWPFLRRAVLRLGEELRMRGHIERTEDVFFVTRAEVETRLGAHEPEDQLDQAGRRDPDKWARADLRATVAARRREWEQQRRLSPPLVLGNPLGARIIARATENMRAAGVTPTAADGLGEPEDQVALKGMPASPGRATGSVRVVRGPEDFARFESGEVLVAQVTAPAWTPLFSLAAAVVTDGGSLAAHASLVAREYGIPAVVGVGSATARLRDGQRVLVDGDRGHVVLLDGENQPTRQIEERG